MRKRAGTAGSGQSRTLQTPAARLLESSGTPTSPSSAPKDETASAHEDEDAESPSSQPSQIDGDLGKDHRADPAWRALPHALSGASKEPSGIFPGDIIIIPVLRQGAASKEFTKAAQLQYIGVRLAWTPLQCRDIVRFHGTLCARASSIIR